MKDKQRNGEAREISLATHMIGEVVPLQQVRDEVFAQKILGDGIAVLPQGDVLYAPADARVAQVFDSHHALTLLTSEGVELLLHVGIDTVQLKGQFFDVKVREGQTVTRGQVLMSFDAQAIGEEGYDLTTPMIVSNSDEFELHPTAKKSVEAGQEILRLTRKE